MGRKKLIFAGLMLGVLLCISGCGNGKDPVELFALRAFFPEYGKNDIALYIDLQNQGEQKIVDTQ